MHKGVLSRGVESPQAFCAASPEDVACFGQGLRVSRGALLVTEVPLEELLIALTVGCPAE